jgi:oligopeptide transport system substrate-binding protein
MAQIFRKSILGAVLASIAGCAWSDSKYFGTTVPRHGPDEVWIILPSEPEWTDPGKCSDSSGGEVAWNMFAGLVELHPKTLEPIPEIATHWDISKDLRTYTFHLRKSEWSDGTPLTARDFEWSWKRVLDPATASKYATFGYTLQNGEAFNSRAVWVEGITPKTTAEQVKEAVSKLGAVDKVEISDEPYAAFVYPGGGEEEKDAIRERLVRAINGKDFGFGKLQAKVADSSVVGVTAVDDYTLRAHLSAPIPFFLYTLGYYTMKPVPRHLIERLIAEGKNPDLWTRVEYVVGNGAYILKEHRFRQSYVFEANERYWNRQSVKTKRIKLPIVESYNTALNLYRAGEVDWLGNNTLVPAEFMDQVKKYKDFDVYPQTAMYFYWVNVTKPPMNDKRVRKAFSLAVDRKSLVGNVTKAGQIAWANLVPDGLAGYKGLKSSLHDGEQARKLLAEAGYPNGKNFPSVTLSYNTTELHKQVAEAVQQMWNKELNIKVNIENLEWKVYLKKLEMFDFQIARLGWVGDYPDPYTFLELVTSNNGNNHAKWSNKTYDRMLQNANATTDGKKRMEMLRDAEKIVDDEQPLIPLYVYTHTTVVKPYLMGHWPNYMVKHPWKYMWIDKRWYGKTPETPIPNDPPKMVAER